MTIFLVFIASQFRSSRKVLNSIKLDEKVKFFFNLLSIFSSSFNQPIYNAKHVKVKEIVGTGTRQHEDGNHIGYSLGVRFKGAFSYAMVASEKYSIQAKKKRSCYGEY
jgi:hypothetical protein